MPEDMRSSTPILPTDRHATAKRVREKVADFHNAGAFEPEQPNGDEAAPYLFSFTKGLEHDAHGLLIDDAHFAAFRTGTLSADPKIFEQVPLVNRKEVFPGHGAFPDAFGDPVRKWESPTAGFCYVLQGPDPQAIKMPPAPAAGSDELAAEMAEVYQMALHRDLPVAAYMEESLVDALDDPFASASFGAVEAASGTLSTLRWFAGKTEFGDGAPDVALTPEVAAHRRCGQAQTPASLFRGVGEGTQDGPFVSQFMVVGTRAPKADRPGRASGKVRYGNQVLPQIVRMAHPHVDYMTAWGDWLDVQNGLHARRLNELTGKSEFVTDADGIVHRPIATLRDLATYVHDDALYQAYLNAALILLSEGAETDRGIPYHGSAHNLFGGNQAPFAVFGGPHLLTLVTEVSSRALRAVRANKFSIHRRLRPEALGGLFHMVLSGYTPNGADEFGGDDDTDLRRTARAQLADKIAPYTHPTDKPPREPGLYKILEKVREHNGATGHAPSWLLPMAFPEGSPMHPAYGAGHATVAGACVTVLKAFFEMNAYDDSGKKTGRKLFVDPADTETDANVAYVPVAANAQDPHARLKALEIPCGLTLVGELNKLAWNISNARNIAGVHYYTDYIESLLLGEAITIGILREQMCTYDPEEKVSMTLPLFVPRRLPAVLLGGSDIKPDDVVEEIVIRSDGTLALPQH
ncbi:phosphatase PAP2 family protein [Roseivivax sediminis]|uniref:PAP2 superfamily protein n=1 Tax=Roseivivax sediminis TaxID=936889 RepID=A0A1I2C3V4_9RHOB|nr:bromoperoxidase [Roseivivax sediminis]SFE63106.1 hypothetical protein SAMN04515678_112114 [Roseivivax sediminis]